MKRLYSLQEVVDAGWAPSVRWLREAIKRGGVSGRRLPRRGRGGRATYGMTDEDINDLIEGRRVTVTKRTVTGLNLTERSARRLLDGAAATAPEPQGAQATADELKRITRALEGIADTLGRLLEIASAGGSAHPGSNPESAS